MKGLEERQQYPRDLFFHHVHNFDQKIFREQLDALAGER
jgi:hypothetical protein